MNTERYTAEQYKAHMAKRQHRKRQIPAPYRSMLEVRYAEYLEAKRLIGEIKAWSYEPDEFPITFNGKPIIYVPDFRVEYNDGRIERHETKFVHYRDKKGKKRAVQQAKVGMLKLKIAADRYPEETWILVEMVKGRWIKTEQ